MDIDWLDDDAMASELERCVVRRARRLCLVLEIIFALFRQSKYWNVVESPLRHPPRGDGPGGPTAHATPVQLYPGTTTCLTLLVVDPCDDAYADTHD
jgi:hypothetical protein